MIFIFILQFWYAVLEHYERTSIFFGRWFELDVGHENTNQLTVGITVYGFKDVPMPELPEGSPVGKRIAIETRP